MKVITKGNHPDIRLYTPAIGSVGDKCDRSMVGECDLDTLLRRYSNEIAAWTPSVGDIVDTTILPDDPVDAINVARDLIGNIKPKETKPEVTQPEETKPKVTQPEETKPVETKPEIKENNNEASSNK